MTGNFYCVPSGCAKVVYREYLPPVVRWRYEGEDWQEIEGDDYAISETQDCSGIPWQFYYQIANGAFKNGDECIADNWGGITTRSFYNYSNETPFNNLRIQVGSTISTSVENVGANTDLTANPLPPISGTCRFGRANLRVIVDTPVAKNRIILNITGYTIRVWEFRPRDEDLSLCTNECTFTVYKNGEIVYQETRSECPEVEKLDCRLSDEYKKIAIEKLPYLTRIEIVDYAYSIGTTFGIPFPLPEQVQIPDESLNIYRNEIYLPVPPELTQSENGSTSGFGFITQISSAPGCPPPEYTVICDCDSCESCPDGTCPVECDGHICCYDTETGVAVKSIPIDEYCGG